MAALEVPRVDSDALLPTLLVRADSIKSVGSMSEEVSNSASRIALRTPGSEITDPVGGAAKYGAYPFDRFSMSATAEEYNELPNR